MTRGGPGRWTMITFVATALLVFIALPVLSVLYASFKTARFLSPQELVTLTSELLDEWPQADRTERLGEWWQRARSSEVIDTQRIALQLNGIPINWREDARYAQQERAFAKLRATWSEAETGTFDEQLPLINAALHRRVILSAQLEGVVPESTLAAFRLGQMHSLGLGHYHRIVADEHLRRAMRNSLMLAMTSTLCVVFLAFCLAYAVQRARIPGAPLVRAVALLPLVSPPVLMAFAILLLAGRQGLITYGFLDQTLGLIDSHYTNIYGFWGVVMAQVFGLLPPAYVIIDNALSRQDGSLEEAAVSAGGGYFGVLSHVTLPMVMPALIRAGLITFVLSMTDFGNPEVIGRGYPVLAGEVLDLILGTGEFPLAAALCVSLLAPGLALYLLAERYFSRRQYDTGPRASGSFHYEVPGAVRGLLTAVSAAVVTTILGLFAVVIASAFTVYWGVDYGFTLAHFTGERPDLLDPTFADSGFGTRYLGLDSVWTSVKVASVAAPLGGLFALLTVYTLDRLRPPGGALLGFTALLPAVFPGIIFGIGYLYIFNHPLGISELALTGTMAILVINILFGNLFVGILAGRTVLQKTSAGLEDAAITLGANTWQRFSQVMFPLMRQAFLLGALFIFIDAMTTLSSVIFLVSGQHMLASVLIFNQAIGVEYGSAAAKSTTILGIVLVTVTLAFLVERRFNRMLRRE